MRKGFRLVNVLTTCRIVFSLALSFLAIHSNAQQSPLHVGQFVLFGGSSNCPAPGQTAPPPPGCGVQIGTSCSVTGGKIGSYSLVTTTGNAQLNSDIRSGRLVLSNSNTVNGSIAVGNSTITTNTIFTTGSNFSASSNVFVNGTSNVGSGTITGFVKHPGGTTYTGPVPAGGEIIGDPQLQNFPLMPAITTFPAAGSTSINSTQTISPGNYGQLALNGAKTLTFNGPGTYVFSKIKNTGNNNKFIFNFQNTATGIIKIYVHGDVDLYKLNIELQNGGSASRIFMEVHGTGSSSPNGNYAWMMANGASGSNQSTWYGTVWAPYAGINVGSGSTPAKVIGALWSGTQVVLDNGVGVTFAMYEGCQAPNANAGPDKFTDCDNPATQLNGSSSTSNVTFSWSVVNGSFTSSVPNPTVSAGGTYVLTVYGSACYVPATDTAIVHFTPCILPYYPPSSSGKVQTKIGSELTSLNANSGNVADSAKAIFLLKPDSVLIDIITFLNQTASLRTTLMGPAYGLRDTLNNGPNSLLITGWFAIAKLPLLNNVAGINYVRPAFPAISNSGNVMTQGDSAIRSGLVRNGYGLTGEGIKVGVLSDSYNTKPGDPAGDDVASFNLPGVGNPFNPDTVQVLQEYPFGVRSDEGRAMLQIVHDVAPKAKLAFRTGFLTERDLAQGILQLADSNCNVIVDDITFITAPFFKPGVVENSIKTVTQAGVSYVTAAGNFGVKSYESVLNPVAPPAGLTGRAHNFNGGDIFQNDSLKGTLLQPGIYTIVLQWTDNIYSLDGSGGTTHDLDIYLTDDNGITLFGFNRNNLGGDPIEILPFTVTANTATNILVVDASAGPTDLTSTVRFKYIVFRGNLKINEHNQGTSTIAGHGSADSAITVGAALYTNTPPYNVNPPTIASFSSQGGTPVNNVIPNKPNLVGPNGVNTTVSFGSIDFEGDGRPNFFGTSAAAPHIAGAVALMMEAKQRFNNSALSPWEAKNLLETSATDMASGGFDLATGYGLANIDSAMRALGRPTPRILKLELADSSLTPGAQPMVLIVHGKFLSSNTKIIFAGDTLQNTSVLNSETATATIPAFNDEQFVKLYTKPKSLSGLDGGLSDSLSMTGIVKKLVRVIAADKTKKYGEDIPAFNSIIIIDSDSIQNTTLTPQDLGLDNISYLTNATPYSFVGVKFIRPSRIFNPAIPADATLLAKYNYVFEDGVLTVEKLDVTVTPVSDTMYYGDPVGTIQFNYQFDTSLNFANASDLLDTIALTHNGQLANNVIGLVNGQAVTIINGQAIPIINGQAVTIINGQAVTIINGQAVPIINSQAINIINGQAQTILNTLQDSQVQNLSFMVSESAVQNARMIVNNSNATNVIDITQESILDYNNNPLQTELLTSVSQTHTRGIVSASALINGQAQTIINGQAQTILNGQAVTIINGQAVTIINGQAIPIINSLNSTTNRTAAIIDENDTLPAGVNHLKSINLITGLTQGVQTIIAGALLNDNLNITYALGRLTILPRPITVQAKDSSKSYGQAITLDSTRFTLTSGAMQYGESLAKVTLNSSGTPATAVAGNHPIIPSAAVGSTGTDVANYLITYSNGNLAVGKAPILVKANDASRFYGYANPAFSATYSGFVNGENFASSGITGSPSLTTTATTASTVGNYPITAATGSLASNNYTFSFAGGTLAITKAPLTVKADDKVIFQGDPLPAFTGTITGLKNGDVANYSYGLTSPYSGSAGTYTIAPTLVLFPKSANYDITPLTGTLYVNPKGPGAKKLRPYLDCVEELINPPSLSRRYIAHYFCENTNATVVYVPIGPDNKLSSAGSFDASNQPVIFMPGTTRFDVPFDGVKLTWELRTYETNKKTSVASDASSTSGKCSINYPTSARGESNVVIVTEMPIEQQLSLYPNPVDHKAIVTGVSIGSEKSMRLFDASGKRYDVRISKSIPGRSVELDLSSLTPGIYFLQVQTTKGNQTVRIVKN